MNQPLAPAAVVGLALLASGACGGDELAGRNRATATATVVAPIHRLVVQSDAGDVSLARGSAGVEIRAAYRYNGDRPRMERTVDGGVLTLRDGCHKRDRCSADFTLRVPAGVAIQVRTDAGDVRGRALASSDVELKTDAGEVRLELTTVPRRVEIRSDAGDVELSVPRGTYAVQADSDAGDVKVEGLVKDDRAPRRISARTDAGDVTVRGE